MLRVLPPTNQTCPATNEIVADGEKLLQGRIQDFFRRGALFSFSTSTPINHIVFFWQTTSCIRKPQVISRGVRTPCTLPLDPSPLQKVETTSTLCSKLFAYMLRVSLAHGKLVLQHAWRDFPLILSNQKSVFTQIC